MRPGIAQLSLVSYEMFKNYLILTLNYQDQYILIWKHSFCAILVKGIKWIEYLPEIILNLDQWYTTGGDIAMKLF